ncbi:MAG: PAS domain S-box protein [Thermomicrobiales bacterium]
MLDAADVTRLRATLLARRETIADDWFRAVAGTSYVPLSTHDVRLELASLVDRVIDALFQEPFDQGQARAIGAALAQLHYIQPAALGGTQEALGRQLSAQLPDAPAPFRARVAAFLGGLATGFSREVRDQILAEQAAIRGALLSERQRAEEALRESEARFRAIFAGAAVAIAVAGTTGQLLEANPALQRLLGYTEEELRAASFIQFMHPDDIAAEMTLFRELVSGQRNHYEIEERFRHKDGHVVWAHMTVSLVRDAQGRPQFAIGMGEDITPRKEAEATIARLHTDLEQRVVERTAQLTAANRDLADEVTRRTWAESGLRFLAGASETLASSLDYQATLTSAAYLVVPALADWCVIDMIGDDRAGRYRATAHADSAKGDYLRRLGERYAPDQHTLAPILTVLQTRQPVLAPVVSAAEAEAFARDAEQYAELQTLGIVSVMLVPLLVGERTIGVMTLVSSAPERQYSTADLALAEDFGRRVAVAIDNARLYQEARMALAARDEFLSVAAHELKTPITNMRGFTELLLRQFVREDGPDPQRARRALGALDRESQRLSRLVTQLLDVSRIEAGQLALERTVTNVTRLVEEAAASARLMTNRHEIAVHGDPDVVASVDPLRLEQVLSNLVSNAIKYSPAGGPIEFMVTQPEPGQIAIVVQDQGIGILPADREQIFTRFYRADPSDRVAGMGLGLYISQQIVTMHEGHIEVSAAPAGGTRFTITLPTRMAQDSEGR